MWYGWSVTLYLNVRTMSKSMRIARSGMTTDRRNQSRNQTLARKIFKSKRFLCMILNVNLILEIAPRGSSRSTEFITKVGNNIRIQMVTGL